MAKNTSVTAADIARLAQVSRTTVSNWRRRHENFPEPIHGSDNRALFDLTQVEQWLAHSDRMPERTPHEHLWERIRAVATNNDALREVVADVQELLLHLTRGHTEAVDTVKKHLATRPEGHDLLHALREATTSTKPLRELSAHLHDAYLAALGGKTHITPEPLARLIVDLADVRGAEVFDPACGTGSLLRTASKEGAVGLYGQESEPATARLAQALVGLVPNGAPGRVLAGDSLTTDAFAGRLFDTVLCNPPFNQRARGADILAHDERWTYGVPPRSESELAWIQHCLAHTRPGGRLVALMPPAAACRPSGRRIRRELLRRGALWAVIGLPTGAAAPLHVGLHLWVLRRPETETEQRQKVLFVNTENTQEGGTEHRSIDREELRAGVRGVWRAFLDEAGSTADVPGFSRAVPVVDLLDDSVDLTPRRHLPTAVVETSPRETHRRVGKVRRRLLRTLEDTRSSVPGSRWSVREPGEWPMTTVEDLARSGVLAVHRAPSVPVVDPGQGTGPRVLTPADVNGGDRASKRLPTQVGLDTTGHRLVQAGDVLIPSAMARNRVSRVRVATDVDAGALLGSGLHLVRPNPTHVDAWFLAGFLADEDNLRRAGQGSTVLRVDLRRLRVPLLPLEEQRRYGAAFRELHEFRQRLEHARDRAGELGERLTRGLRAGLLEPPPPPGGQGAPEVVQRVTEAP